MDKYKGLDKNNSNEFWECKYKLKIAKSCYDIKWIQVLRSYNFQKVVQILIYIKVWWVMETFCILVVILEK